MVAKYEFKKTTNKIISDIEGENGITVNRESAIKHEINALKIIGDYPGKIEVRSVFDSKKDDNKIWNEMDTS